MSKFIFNLENCELGYQGKSVLHDVALRISAGEKIAILGKSGSGKSTLLNHVFYKYKAQKIAIIPQDLGLVKSILRQVQLENKSSSVVHTLSGGEKQRIALARALHQNVPVLFADEPVSAVDSRQAEQLLTYINLHFTTVVYALHDINLAMKYSNRIIGVHHGRIIIDSKTEEVDQGELTILYE